MTVCLATAQSSQVTLRDAIPGSVSDECVLEEFENHMHMVVLYTVWYNYVKQHKSLKGLSPAMAADLAEMVDATMPKLGKRGPYKKHAAATA